VARFENSASDLTGPGNKLWPFYPEKSETTTRPNSLKFRETDLKVHPARSHTRRLTGSGVDGLRVTD